MPHLHGKIEVRIALNVGWSQVPHTCEVKDYIKYVTMLYFEIRAVSEWHSHLHDGNCHLRNPPDKRIHSAQVDRCTFHR